jgi:hypothetical protein
MQHTQGTTKAHKTTGGCIHKQQNASRVLYLVPGGHRPSGALTQTCRARDRHSSRTEESIWAMRGCTRPGTNRERAAEKDGSEGTARRSWPNQGAVRWASPVAPAKKLDRRPVTRREDGGFSHRVVAALDA